MDYKPSKADPDLWFRDCGEHYEYIARYVDDVISFSKDPMHIMSHLATIYKMKGVGKPQYYLGGDVVNLGEEWQNHNCSVHSLLKLTLGIVSPNWLKCVASNNLPLRKHPSPTYTIQS